MALPTCELGRTGEVVTRLGFGSMELRGHPPAPALGLSDIGSLLRTVLDHGITVIDTSIDYGHSETLLGRFLPSHRDDLFLASKCGCLAGLSPADPLRPVPHDYGEANIRAGVEQSLARLGTDRLDLVQVHHSPSAATLERDGTMDTLGALRDEGKIRFVGISATLPELSDHLGYGLFDAFQIPYSALQREHEDLVADAAAAGAGVLIRGGLARGGPAGGKPWDDPAGLAPGESRRRWKEARLDDLWDGDASEFLLRFTLSHPGIHSVLVGTSNPEHVAANARAAAKGPLPDDVCDEAKRRLAAAGSLPGE